MAVFPETILARVLDLPFGHCSPLRSVAAATGKKPTPPLDIAALVPTRVFSHTVTSAARIRSITYKSLPSRMPFPKRGNFMVLRALRHRSDRLLLEEDSGISVSWEFRETCIGFM